MVCKTLDIVPTKKKVGGKGKPEGRRLLFQRREIEMQAVSCEGVHPE